MNYHIITAGGGVSGVACSYIGAKLGLKCLLVERSNYLGGLATGGLVVPAMKTSSRGLNTEFFNDLVVCAKKYNAQVTYEDGNEGWFNPVVLKIVLDDMLSSVGVNVLYESEITNFKAKPFTKEIKSVEINNKTLSLPYESKYFVDATGDGNFAKLLNCGFWDDKEQKQPSSLRFILSNVNLRNFRDFIMELDPERDVTTSCEVDTQVHLSTAYTWDSDKKWALAPYFKKAIDEKVLMPSDTDYFQLFSIPGMPTSIALNCPRIKQNNAFGEHLSLSKGLVEARHSIWRLSEFCRKYLPGFEDSFISNIADMTGVREFKRVKCKYDYTINDILTQKTFEHPVVRSDYPVDIHSQDKNNSMLKMVKPYELPLESLMSKDYDNLYISGRCLGVDFKAQAALRVIPSCMSMGEGVARSIKEKCL